MRHPADITPLTFLDYPKKAACIFWYTGCNLRCPYCYNPELVLSHGGGQDEMAFLRERAGFLDAVVLSGGESTLNPDIAELCDVFYIGGTKVGALFGEAVVFTNPELGEAFFTEIKQHGALLAKGRMLGIQFDELFENNLYEKIAKHAVDLAMRIKRELKAKGYEFYNDSYTNQQFPIISKAKLDSIQDKVILDDWGPYDDNGDRRLVRITTSWATTEEAVDTLLELL